MGSVCVSSCICCMLVSVMHPFVILSVLFCSLLAFVSDASGDHMVETYSNLGIVMALHVASNVSICFPHVVDVNYLSICIVCLFLLCCLYVCCM